MNLFGYLLKSLCYLVIFSCILKCSIKDTAKTCQRQKYCLFFVNTTKEILTTSVHVTVLLY